MTSGRCGGLMTSGRNHPGLAPRQVGVLEEGEIVLALEFGEAGTQDAQKVCPRAGWSNHSQ